MAIRRYFFTSLDIAGIVERYLVIDRKTPMW
mgnify:CR=1 FL=1